MRTGNLEEKAASAHLVPLIGEIVVARFSQDEKEYHLFESIFGLEEIRVGAFTTMGLQLEEADLVVSKSL